MSQEPSRPLIITDEQLRSLEKERRLAATYYQSKAAAAQREADAARKELKRRKRNETNPTGRQS